MIGTNHDLKSMREAIDSEILRLTALERVRRGQVEGGYIEDRLSILSRERRAIGVALVNRQIEASRKIVSFSKWVDGNGALGVVLGHASEAEIHPAAHTRG